MAEAKSSKYKLSARGRDILLLRNRDREKSEQFKYQGKLIEMENSLVRSQLEEVQHMPKYSSESAQLMRSKPTLHLPPIRKQGNDEDTSYLRDVRNRDYKKYINSRNLLQNNQIHQTMNDELKQKLFDLKYNKYMVDTKDNCKAIWRRFEETSNKQLNSSMENSTVINSSPHPNGAVSARQATKDQPAKANQQVASPNKPATNTTVPADKKIAPVTTGGTIPPQGAGQSIPIVSQGGNKPPQQPQVTQPTQKKQDNNAEF